MIDFNKRYRNKLGHEITLMSPRLSGNRICVVASKANGSNLAYIVHSDGSFGGYDNDLDITPYDLWSEVKTDTIVRHNDNFTLAHFKGLNKGSDRFIEVFSHGSTSKTSRSNDDSHLCWDKNLVEIVDLSELPK